MANAGVQEFSPELLRMYYDRVFPVQNMCRWLSYGTMEGEAAAQAPLEGQGQVPALAIAWVRAQGGAKVL